MRRVIVLFTQVPMLAATVVSAVFIAYWWDVRLWNTDMWLLRPSLGQCVAIILAVITIADALRGMIADIQHGRMGIDILAVVAILATLAVEQYWATWAVTLMIWSGEAIERYAQSKAEHHLTLLVSTAPQTAHVVHLPGVGSCPVCGPRTDDDGNAHRGQDEGAADPDRRGGATSDFRPVAGMSSEAVSKPAGRRAHPDHDTASRFHTIDVERVRLGDVLTVLPGETIPVDGTLLSGSATLDLSAINGEPVPREVFAGGRLMSGAVNGADTLTMRVTQLAQNSQFQRILQLVASARDSRAEVVRTADRLAVPFTVLSLIIAGLAWAMSGDPIRFAQVLVLATPCPLLIAAPVAFMSGTGRLAKAGILIKEQDVLENLGRVSHIFFDKTGTLTVKTPQVVRVERPSGGDDALDDDRVLMLAGVVETYSVHILAKGIVSAAADARRRSASGLRAPVDTEARTLKAAGSLQVREYPVVRAVKEDAGNGITGEVDGSLVRVGRYAYVSAGAEGDEASPSDCFGALAPDEMSTYVSVRGRLVARIVLKDLPRSNAKSSLRQLRSLGVTALTMVTGDNLASARVIAEEVGIDDVHAGLLPQDKLAVLTGARSEGSVGPSISAGASAAPRQAAHPSGSSSFLGNDGTGHAPRAHGAFARLPNADRPARGVTMMVGDGVNDAPVLAAADIGMAITDGTSTAASQSAQVVLMNDDIAAVPRAIAIARRTKRVMLQAVLAGLTLALAGMIAAAFNLIPVLAGALLQEAIDVVSILWSLTALLDRE